MKPLQDRVCDALTLLGLLAVIGFGSASLLPERAPQEAPATQTDADSTAAVPVDTMPELPAAPAVTTVKEEPAEEILTDTIVTGTDEPADTVAVHTDAAKRASHTEHHSDESGEQPVDSKPQGEHTDNLFE